jgi:hypothetical protein
VTIPTSANAARQHQMIIGLVVGQVAFAALFVFLLLSAFHEPIPHALPVGVVAPKAVTQKLQEALDAHEPGAFNLRSYPNAGGARLGVLDGQVDGALLLRSGGLTLLSAGAGGIGPVQALTGAFSAVAVQTGQHLSVVDVVPPLRKDSEAFSAFFVILGVLFPSLVAGIASSLILRRSSVVRRTGILVVGAGIMGLAAAGIADGVVGFGHYAAIAGTVALFSLATSLPAAALTRVKPAAAVVAFLVFVVIAIPASGGPGALAPFGPSVLRFLDPALPLGIAVGALRSIVYFGGHGINGQLLVLAIWTALGVIALAAIAAHGGSLASIDKVSTDHVRTESFTEQYGSPLSSSAESGDVCDVGVS